MNSTSSFVNSYGVRCSLACGIPHHRRTHNHLHNLTPLPQDKPLAVAPTQVDEAALAAARAEYIRETARIRAKRLREMQESSDSRL